MLKKIFATAFSLALAASIVTAGSGAAEAGRHYRGGAVIGGAALGLFALGALSARSRYDTEDAITALANAAGCAAPAIATALAMSNARTAMSAATARAIATRARSGKVDTGFPEKSCASK